MYTQSDYLSHETVAFTIQTQDKYLMLYHNKYNMWTIPVGKFNINIESPSNAMIREAKEELDIDVLNYLILDCKDIIYSTDKGSMMSRMYLYKILKYNYRPIKIMNLININL